MLICNMYNMKKKLITCIQTQLSEVRGGVGGQKGGCWREEAKSAGGYRRRKGRAEGRVGVHGRRPRLRPLALCSGYDMHVRAPVC